MVTDLKYYDILGVDPNVDENNLKKAYRKKAIKLHPDKNLYDPNALENFQELGIAYNTLKNKHSRKIYDTSGINGLKNNNFFSTFSHSNTSEFFNIIFGSDSFVNWIGKLTMLQRVSEAADILENKSDSSSINNNSSKIRLDDLSNINNKAQKKEKNSNSDTSKKKNFSQEKKEKIKKLYSESNSAKKKKISELLNNLLTRLDEYNENFNQFDSNLNNEIKILRNESFGIHLLHLIGKSYIIHANGLLQSKKTFGFSKIYSLAKSKSKSAVNCFFILKTALNAQCFIDTDEKNQTFFIKNVKKIRTSNFNKINQVEFERFIAGKFLAAAWASTKFEVTESLNKVCIKLLYDQNISKTEKIKRAEGLLYIGNKLVNAKRLNEELNEPKIFEEMMTFSNSKKFSFP